MTPAQLSVPIAPAPTDIQVTGSASTGAPGLAATFSHTFQVKDNGPWPAPGVRFTDTLPASLSYVSSSSSLGTCTGVGNTVTCSFGDMASGGQSNVVISVQAPTTAQSIIDTASVAMAVADRQPANNAVSVSVQAR